MFYRQKSAIYTPTFSTLKMLTQWLTIFGFSHRRRNCESSSILIIKPASNVRRKEREMNKQPNQKKEGKKERNKSNWLSLSLGGIGADFFVGFKREDTSFQIMPPSPDLFVAWCLTQIKLWFSGRDTWPSETIDGVLPRNSRGTPLFQSPWESPSTTPQGLSQEEKKRRALLLFFPSKQKRTLIKQSSRIQYNGRWLGYLINSSDLPMPAFRLGVLTTTSRPTSFSLDIACTGERSQLQFLAFPEVEIYM